MARYWLETICYVGILLAVFFGLCTPGTLKRSTGKSATFQDRSASFPTPFSSDVRDYLMLPTFTSKVHVCEKNCLPVKRRKRLASLSRKTMSDELLTAHGSQQAVLSPFPTLDPFREKKTKNQKNRSGKGNRSQKTSDIKGNNAMLTGGELQKALGLNLGGLDKRARKKFQSKKGQAFPVREGQTPRRLRQHMQHKKKVKQFLQKRIQEQIEERSQNQDFKF